MKLLLGFLLTALWVAGSWASVTPDMVSITLPKGESYTVTKTIRVDVISPLDVCVVMDTSGSFGDDCLENIPSVAPLIVELLDGPNTKFGLSRFEDYPVSPFGSLGDKPYESVLKIGEGTGEAFVAAIQETCSSLRGGNDPPESQLDAIVRAVGPSSEDCGWREDATRILIAISDAPCHLPGPGPHVNDYDSTAAALRATGTNFIGIYHSAAKTCFEEIQTRAGGAVAPIDSEASELDKAIQDAYDEVEFPIDPTFSGDCDGLDFSFSPSPPFSLKPMQSLTFTETITNVAADEADCSVSFGAAGVQRVVIEGADACEQACEECKFAFEGQDCVPEYNIGGKADKPFTDRIVSKTPGVFLGKLQSNGVEPEFIDEETGVVTLMSELDFTPTQFKPFRGPSSVFGKGVGIGHEVYQNGKADAKGKCIRVYFSSWEELKSKNGNVKKHVHNKKDKDDNYCAVFRSKE